MSIFGGEADTFIFYAATKIFQMTSRDLTFVHTSEIHIIMTIVKIYIKSHIYLIASLSNKLYKNSVDCLHRHNLMFIRVGCRSTLILFIVYTEKLSQDT